MGRPLYTSTLLARQAPAVAEPQPAQTRSQRPQASVPVVPKWTRWNAFDPDSDEFFEAEDAVYEAFLTEEQIAQRERQASEERARLMADTFVGYPGGTPQNPAGADTRTPSDRMRESFDYAGPPTGIEVYFLGTPPPALPRQAEDSEAIAGASESLVPRIDVSSPPNGGVRSPSPDPLNIISGVPHLSESPRPMPQDLPPGAISPIPDTPARVSGVFEMASTTPRVSQTTPAGSPHILDLYDHLDSPWAITRTTGSGPRYRIPPIPSPLTS